MVRVLSKDSKRLLWRGQIAVSEKTTILEAAAGIRLLWREVSYSIINSS